MIRAHANAVRALMAGVTVYDGTVPDQPTYPYVVLYASAPLREAPHLDGVQRHAEEDFQTTAVGTTAEQCRWAQEKVHQALLDARPAVPGWKTGRIRHELSQPLVRDTDVSPHVLYAVDGWRFRTIPA